MPRKRKNAFTLVELVTVLVIMAIIGLIATPLVLTLVNNAKVSANKRSVDVYGRSIEISIMSYLLKNNVYPENLTTLEVGYTGSEVTCNIMTLNNDGSLYLSECSVGGSEVRDKNTEDGWYHYGKLISESLKSNTAVETLLAKANDASVTTYEAVTDASHEMYTFNHDTTVQTEALTDYRYIGNDPYNYVTFNNELWRIIGIFTVEDENGNQEQRIKIIRDESIKNFIWNSESVTEWLDSIVNTYLNGEYYNSLLSEAQLMVVPTKFYLGGSSGFKGLGASDYYSFERGEEVYGDRSTEWIGNIGLIYPSDYAYAYANGVDDKCFKDSYNCETSIPTNGWLYKKDSQLTISPFVTNPHGAFLVNSTGYIGTYSYLSHVVYSVGVRPTIYLKSDIQIISGTGSQEAPYQLKLN